MFSLVSFVYFSFTCCLYDRDLIPQKDLGVFFYIFKIVWMFNEVVFDQSGVYFSAVQKF